MKKLVTIALTLTIIAGLAGVSIGYANSKTKATIEAQRNASQTNALTILFPSETTIETDSISYKGSMVAYWVGKSNGKLIGVALKTGKSGYSGIISLLYSVDTANHIMGMSILSQTETPGLGSRVIEVVSKERFPMGLFKKRENGTPWFQDQYVGLSVDKPIKISTNGEWYKLSKEQQSVLQKSNSVTAITGSTISTKAVTEAIQEATPMLEAIKKKYAPKPVAVLTDTTLVPQDSSAATSDTTTKLPKEATNGPVNN